MNRFRSMLFVPGDSPRKFERAKRSGADALILDLEDSVAINVKPDARRNVASMLDQREPGQTIVVRVNAFDTGMTLHDLQAIVGKADGVMLPKCSCGQDVDRMSHYLDAFEVAAGIEPGRTAILPIVTENGRSLLSLGDYRNCGKRLSGLVWGAEDLAADVGATEKRDANGYHGPFRLARDLCLLAAAAAGVPAIDTVYIDIRDLSGLEKEAREARRDGFAAKMVIHPSHVETVNLAFGDSERDVLWARQVVEAFDASPGAAVFRLDGQMIDYAHVALARKILDRQSTKAG
jgi:citrate lyase subunit beta / citryl-CoA lyase